MAAVADLAPVEEGHESSTRRRLSSTDDDAGGKLRTFPLRRIEPFIGRFTRRLQTDADTLRRCQGNIIRLNSSSTIESLPSLSEEYQTAIKSTVQLTGAVDQIVLVRRQVDVADLPALDHRLTLAFNDIVELLVECLQAKDVVKQQSSADCAHVPLEANKNTVQDDVQQSTKDCEQDNCRTKTSETDDKNSSDADCEPKVAETEACLPPAELEKLRQLAIQLELKLHALNDKLQQLHLMIDQCTTDVTQISSSSETENGAVEQQNASFKVSDLKLLMIPVAGAVIGGALGGPVGLVAGLKVGKIAAVSGGIIGLTGGTILKKQTEGRMSNDDDGNNQIRDDSSAIELSSNSPLMNVM